MAKAGFRSSAKLTLVLRDERRATLAFKEGGVDAFLERLKHALNKRVWRDDAKAAPAAAAASRGGSGSAFSTKSAGITGLMRKAKEDSARANNTLNVAFADIDELMIKAKDVVRLAQKLSAAQAKAARAGDDSEEAEFRSAMVQLGIASPVTKETAGSKYHDELSRQLADWLVKRALKLHNGVLLTTDMFCLYNRARGTQMVSPDDLMRACMLFETLQLPVRLKKFDSGVNVVMAASESDDVITDNMLAQIKKRGPLSAFSLSQALDIPLVLAKEQLELAEKKMALCRDETLEGIVFYPNFFPHIS
eukprot:TRINITY_DN5906_c0_g1_i1.p1 TRINITY_DN5906_c0_g1~~TRINITY_DN5906_c0_g1_i1.p1  ORF type:complete len:306 (+),score=122.07 TRINITY_DN5906_c0_g1_i1:262-1179(+)